MWDLPRPGLEPVFPALAGRFSTTAPPGKPLYIYTMEYYSAIKKNEIVPFAATWMDLEIITLSEVSQTKTNIICYHICGI